MKSTENQRDSFPILFEHTFALDQFMSNLKGAEKTLNEIAQIWNGLEVGLFDKDCLENLYNPDYFKSRYSESINLKLENSFLPPSIKSKIISELESSDSFLNLMARLNALHGAGHRWSSIPMNGGMRVFDVNMNMFIVLKGEVSLIPNIREVAGEQFIIIGDTPDKIKVFEKLNEAVSCLNELSGLLEKTGLWNTNYHPIIEQSKLILLMDESYVVNAEIFI